MNSLTCSGKDADSELQMADGREPGVSDSEHLPWQYPQVPGYWPGAVLRSQPQQTPRNWKVFCKEQGLIGPLCILGRDNRLSAYGKMLRLTGTETRTAGA
jgi:hypothetical protein